MDIDFLVCKAAKLRRGSLVKSGLRGLGLRMCITVLHGRYCSYVRLIGYFLYMMLDCVCNFSNQLTTTTSY